MIFIISSVSFVFKTIGKAFTQANCLNKTHFHSITGRAASGQISQSHKTAVQSLITATVFHFIV
jgi:hypothetical protein